MQQLVNAVVLGSIYSLFALGISLTWGGLNVLNVAHGAIFMFAAFCCYLLTQRANVHLPLGLLIVFGVLVGAVAELLLDLLAFRPIRRRVADSRAGEQAMMVASVGLAAIPVAIAQVITVDSPFGITAQTITTSVYRWGAVYVTEIEIIIVITSLCLGIFTALWLAHTRGGRALRALSVDAETASLMGISQNRLSALAMMASGATAGLAGIFLAMFLTSIAPETGQDLLLEAFAAVVLGGVGSIWGTLVGAYVLAAGETVVVATTSGSWTDAVSFGIIIIVLLIRPSGLFGRQAVDRA
jgi:branched-chain amino acid transport system permease protein